MAVFTWDSCSAALPKERARQGLGASRDKPLELRPALLRRERCIAQVD